MRLVTFNTWGGRAGIHAIKEFFRKYRSVDIFCLQEIWQTENPSLVDGGDDRIVLDLLDQIATCLPDHRFYFRPQFRGIYGLATFIRHDIQVENEGELFVFKDKGYENPRAMGNHGRNIQCLAIRQRTGLVTIVNFHGLWNGMGKTDTPDRVNQSQKIVGFLSELKTPMILAGDFNLGPETQSLKMLEKICPKNLIRENGITSTRSRFYTKPEKYADYILASEDIEISSFEVLPDEASDHLALQVSFL